MGTALAVTAGVLLGAAFLLARARWWPLGPCPRCSGRAGRSLGSTKRAYGRCHACGGSGRQYPPAGPDLPEVAQGSEEEQMRGEWYTTSGGGGAGQLLGVLGGAGAVAGLAWLIVTFLWLIAAVAGLALAAVIAVGVWMRRRGADVATVSHAPPAVIPRCRPGPLRPSGARSSCTFTCTGRPRSRRPIGSPRSVRPVTAPIHTTGTSHTGGTSERHPERP